jgi:hypothetical protein
MVDIGRRSALGQLAALTVGAFVAPTTVLANTQTLSFGAVAPTMPQKKRFRRLPSFHQKYKPLIGISYQTKKNVFLWKYLEQAMCTKYVPHNQINKHGDESEGDCVGHATALGCDILAASDIYFRREPERWVAKASVEPIYWGSRYEIGRRLIGKEEWNKFKNFSGSIGEWGAMFVNEYGVLHRCKYLSGNNYIDLTEYNPGRSRSLRSSGVPDWLESMAKRHPVKDISNVKSGTESLDSVVSGNPVLICSSYAFPEEHDKYGWAKPYLGRIRKRWSHALLLAGFVVINGERGGVLLNSHGCWNEHPAGMPGGSLTVKEKYIDLMVKDWGDCWSLAGYIGHQARTIRRHLLYVRGMCR